MKNLLIGSISILFVVGPAIAAFLGESGMPIMTFPASVRMMLLGVGLIGTAKIFRAINIKKSFYRLFNSSNDRKHKVAQKSMFKRMGEQH